MEDSEGSVNDTINDDAISSEATTHNTLDHLWWEKYKKLEAFRNANGHCNVSQSYLEDKPLARWVANQRAYQKAGTLRKDRVQLLNDLGFSWSKPGEVRKYNTVPWMERYNQVVAYKEKNGHCQVGSTEDKGLNRWLNNQRAQYRAGTLRKDRQELLDKIGFVWTGAFGPIKVPDQIKEESWNRMFERLKELWMQHGHTGIADDELMQWLTLQRTLRKQGRLEAKYEKALQEIGLSWESQGNANDATRTNHDRQNNNMLGKERELWMAHFRWLSEFKNEHGHTNVPRTGETTALAQWLLVQQRLMDRGKLSEDQAKRLLGVLNTGPVVAATSNPPSSIISAGSKDHARADTVSESNPAATSTTTGATLSDFPTAKVGNATAEGARSGRMASCQKEDATTGVDQKFAIGTRIEKLFEDDRGAMQPFGGIVVAFEQFEEEDGTRLWGYMIHYDDGDKEHMVEADLAKHIVAVKNKKRALKSQGKPNIFKRLKLGHTVTADDCSDAMQNKKTNESRSVQAQADVSETAFSDRVENAETDNSKGTKIGTKSRVDETSLRDECDMRLPHFRDAQLPESSVEMTTSPLDAQSRAAGTIVTKPKEVPTNPSPWNDFESPSSIFEEDHSSHALLKGKWKGKDPKSVENMIGFKKIQPEMIELVDGEKSTAATGPLTFFDLSDNERQKSYGGHVVDYIYLDDEKEWFYFVQYDDGDTEFMDEWEVAKFSRDE